MGLRVEERTREREDTSEKKIYIKNDILSDRKQDFIYMYVYICMAIVKYEELNIKDKKK